MITRKPSQLGFEVPGFEPEQPTKTDENPKNNGQPIEVKQAELAADSGQYEFVFIEPDTSPAERERILRQRGIITDKTIQLNFYTEQERDVASSGSRPGHESRVLDDWRATVDYPLTSNKCGPCLLAHNDRLYFVPSISRGDNNEIEDQVRAKALKAGVTKEDFFAYWNGDK